MAVEGTAVNEPHNSRMWVSRNEIQVTRTRTILQLRSCDNRHSQMQYDRCVDTDAHQDGVTKQNIPQKGKKAQVQNANATIAKPTS